MPETLDSQPFCKRISLAPDDTRRLAILCGPFSAHLQQIEQRLAIRIRQRGNTFILAGEERKVGTATLVLDRLYGETSNNRELTPAMVHLHLLQLAQEDDLKTETHKAARHAAVEPSNGAGANRKATLAQQPEKTRPQPATPQDEPLLRTGRCTIRPTTSGQRALVRAMCHHEINFAIGPAGTGKTYLAVASALATLERDEIQRLVLVRPAVEAGEKLGFLPGDPSRKVDPYLRPLYDALHEMHGATRVNQLLERNIIEIAPLAFMRGRSLNHCYIILDEAQNTTEKQMKMFLTRIGFGSRATITGDITQVDLPAGQGSGLIHASQVLRGVEGIHFSYLDKRDIVRHPLVQRIVAAYGAHQASRQKRPRDED